MPVAPIKAQQNAKLGLELRRKYKRGGTLVGVARARDISNGVNLSEDTIKRMAQFNRHRQNYQPDKKEPDGGDTAGTIAWLLWGGNEGVNWALALRKLSKLSKQQMKRKIKKFPTKAIEYKELPLKIKKDETGVDNVRDGMFIVEGYASTFGNADLGNDIVMKGAFTESIAKRKPKLLLAHKQDEAPIGNITELYEDERGLYFKAELPIEDDRVGKKIMPQIKVGSLDSFSIGYNVIKASFDKKSGARLLEKLRLFEISFVSLPMNEMAQISYFKSVSGDTELPFASRDYEWNSDEAVNRIREYTDSMEKPSDDYEDYFLYYDDQQEDDLTGYKLPFVDIIDDEPMIVPRAIFAIAGALQGARGGLDIPDSERELIVTIVNNLYERMAQEFNDETLISPLKMEKKQDLNLQDVNDIRSLEKVLKTKFSNDDAKLIIAKLKEIHQREVEVKKQREADEKIMDEILNNLNNLIKK
jgi:HK97 family phage prohead protease